MTDWSLEYNGTTKTLRDWGLTDASLKLSALGEVDTFNCTEILETHDLAEVFPFGAAIRLIHPDGTTWFRGTRDVAPRVFQPSTKYRAHTFVGPGDFLRRNYFQQDSFFYTDNNGTTSSQPKPIVWLNIDGNGLVSATDQIERVLTYAIAIGAPFQLGTIDSSTCQPPNSQDTLVTMEAVIARQLQHLHDHVIWFDYATNPPTVHCRKQANLPLVTLKKASPTNQTDFSIQLGEIVPRDDLRRPSVTIMYEIVGDNNGQSTVNTVIDRAPANATGQEDRAYHAIVPLRGSSSTFQTGTIEAEAINLTSIDWWKGVFPWLARTEIVNASILAGSSASTVNLATYPNRIIAGTPAGWMPIGWQKARLSAEVAFTLRSGTVDFANVTRELIAFDCVVTDSPPGEQIYSDQTGGATGDPLPIGLAAYYLSVLNAPQWDGSLTLKEQTLTGQARPGVKINITGDQAAYATFEQRVVETSFDLFSGATSLRFGYRTFAGIDELVRLALVWRNNARWSRQSVQEDGLAGGLGGELELPEASANDYASAGPSQKSLISVAQPATPTAAVIKMDSPNQVIELTLSGKTIRISLADLGSGETARFRDTGICDSAGNTHIVRALRTPIPSEAP